MRYKEIIISIACICFLNCSFGQFKTFIKKFENRLECSLPFVIGAATFDIYNSEDDVYAIPETEVQKY